MKKKAEKIFQSFRNNLQNSYPNVLMELECDEKENEYIIHHSYDKHNEDEDFLRLVENLIELYLESSDMDIWFVYSYKLYKNMIDIEKLKEVEQEIELKIKLACGSSNHYDDLINMAVAA